MPTLTIYAKRKVTYFVGHESVLTYAAICRP